MLPITEILEYWEVCPKHLEIYFTVHIVGFDSENYFLSSIKW